MPSSINWDPMWSSWMGCLLLGFVMAVLRSHCPTEMAQVWGGRGCGGVLLTGLFPWLTQPAEPKDHQPRGGPTHNRLGPPLSTTN